MQDTPDPLAGLSTERRLLLQKILQEKARARSAPAELRSVPRDGALPLSFAQTRFWFIDRMEPGSAAHNITSALRLRGRLDAEALHRTLTEIVRRHEVLRTVFAVRDEEPEQVVLPPAPALLPRVDLSGLPEEARERELLRTVEEASLLPFDLARGPLFRCRVVVLGPDRAALVMGMHHIVSDGWSMEVLTRELLALYGAFSKGLPSPLAELPIQYADYAVWQRQWLTGEGVQRELEWWRERLAGAPPVLDLPTDRPRPVLPGMRGAKVPVEFRAAEVGPLRALAQEEGATPFMVLMAALQLLLARWSGQEDVSVGMPVAGRGRVETEGLIGPFLNTLVVRTDLSGDPTARVLLGRVREATLGAQSHQDVPFERLVEELQPERVLGRTPLFQVIFSLQSSFGGSGSGAGHPGELSIVPIHPEGIATEFDLGLSLTEWKERAAGELVARTELFELSTVARMAEHLRRLLAQVTAYPDRAISTLELLTGEERAQVLGAWSATAPAAPGEETVHALFAAQAARTPDSVALVHGAETLTYAVLERRAAALAGVLRERGAGPEVRVGVCLEWSPELVVAMLATFRAGGVYLPLDPSYPAERLGHVLADAGARVLVTDGRSGAWAAGFAGEVVRVEEEAGREPAAEAPEAPVDPANLAYVLYTSGSTGTPKGVAVEHRAAAAHLRTMGRVLDLGPGDRLLQLASPAFDVSLEQVLLPLTSGAAVVLRGAEPLSPAEYLTRLGEQGITHGDLPPAYLHAVVEDGAGAAPPGLRVLLLGGEALPAAVARRWSERTGVRLVNGYGPTETVVTATACDVPGGVPEGYAGSAAPIGRPLAGRTAYVLDPAGNPVPAGVPGELLLGGLLARGYLGRPELTAERFVPDPFGRVAGARLYHTGDRVRWLAEGTLEFLGRTDQQLKVRGFRVEPGEVEAALERHPSVREAAVAVRGDRLVGWVVPASGAGVDAEEVRARLRGELPEYMVPSALVELEALPLTPTGKIDRRALPAPAETGGGYVEPRTPEEATLAAIWGDVLKRDRVGAHDDFFALGGHSLLAMRVVSRIREGFGVEVPVRALFEAPTVAALAERIGALLVRERTPDRLEAWEIRPAPRDRPLPVSFAQQRLWLVHRMDPGSPAYNLPFPLRIRGALDAEVLRRSLAEIAARHEALRTVFPEVDGEPVQEILPAGPLAMPLVDLGTLPPEAREEELARLVDRDAAHPFDLARGPLLRATWVRLAGDEHAVLFTLHHIAGDEWSVGVLVREVSELYAAFSRGEPSTLPPLKVQYADFAAWQRGWLTEGALEEQVRYWRGRLADAPPVLELPTDRPRPAVASDRAGSAAIVIPPETAVKLRALSRCEGATLFMTVLTGFVALLGRWAGTDDVVVGTPVAGRTRRDTEDLIGFFVNTLVVRADLSGDPTVAEAVRRVRERVLEAQTHQDLPFERLVDEVKTERSLGHHPLFQVLFTMHAGEQGDGGDLALGELETEPLGRSASASAFDLGVTLHGGEDEILALFNYRADLFDSATVERMAGHFASLLEGMAADPGRRLREVELLEGEERDRVLHGWNATERAYPPQGWAHERVAARAAAAPDAPALLWEGGALTYAELARRARALAAGLRDRGVGPETPVGLCAERGPELVVGALGILGAGGAYVPLDPAYPAERLGWVLADAGVRVVVSAGDAADALPGYGGATVRVDGPGGPGEDAGPEPVALSPRNLAYVIHTSGSTGRPKGVAVEHGSLANLLDAAREALGVGPGDVVPSLASFAFDIWIFETLLPLTVGAAVRLVGRERVLEPERLVEEAGDATALHAVPALMRGIVRAAQGGRLPRVRRAWVGGDRVPPELLEEMRAAFPAAQTHVLYGPTEAAVLASEHRVPAEGPVEGHRIGRPLGNVRLYVCGRGGAVQPVGVPGELWVGGAGVARGYLGRPELTADRFVPDAFSGEPGARLYRTGDRTRRLADGTLEFLGRVDAQVKVRGFRIEPGEVEAALERHRSVREAVVVVREDVPGEPVLAGYVVAVPGAWMDAPTLRAHLREELPEHMIPAALVVLESLPLTPTGKLDRRALPAPDAAPAASEYVAPSTPEEVTLAAIWAEVLKRDRVGANDDFFGLGGHSLLATRVVSRVREALGVELPLRALFEAPTVAGLAERVTALLQDKRETPRVNENRTDPLAGLSPERRLLLQKIMEEKARARRDLNTIGPAPRDGAIPLSFTQARFWFIDQMEPGSAASNIPISMRLRGPLDTGALGRTLTEIVRRHEVLRTVFAMVEEEPVQVVLPPAPVHFPRVELTGLPEDARQQELLRLVQEAAVCPFDLARGPLFRARLVLLGPDEAAVLIAMHHIVSDGWSMEVLTGEIMALYGAFSQGLPSPLPELPVQFADYAVWQRRLLTGETMQRELAWWRERLAGAPPVLDLPTDRPRPTLPGTRGAAVPFKLDEPEVGPLRALALKEAATPFMVLLAALQLVLSRWSGQDDVSVGVPMAGRGRSETEGLIGPFLNTLVIRTDLSGDPTARGLLGRVREATLGAQSHQDIPFERLVEELAPERSLQHTPLFQFIFSLQSSAGVGDPPRTGVLKIEQLPPKSLATEFDLGLSLNEWKHMIAGDLTYRAELFERATAARMMEHLRRLLTQMTAHPDLPVSTLELLTAEERAQVLGTWSVGAPAVPGEETVHALFAAQAARTPDAPALVSGTDTLTYVELDRRSGELAALLRERGAGPETRVGVCLPWNPELVVALLAVLKAGGVYVPLDPSYPADRLAFMVADSRARVLVTDAGAGEWAAEFGGEVVRVEETAGREPAGDAPASPAGPDNLAYVIYTSGSTGTPKGVAVEHRAIAAHLRTMGRVLEIGFADRLLQLASAAFDVSLEQVLLPLTNGAVVVLRGAEPLSPAEFLTRAGELGITHGDVPPAYLHAVVEDGAGAPPPRLRVLLVGGEALPFALAQRWSERAGGIRLVNGYGPTEAVVTATACDYPGGVPAGFAGSVAPIGRPLPGRTAYVLDPAGSPAPAGVPGELLLGGLLARAYLDRPELTAERFVPDAFGGLAGARLYRTGDRVRWLADGTLEFLGRMDQQLKVRGFRVEPGEVEAALDRHPAVREAAVGVRGERLVGWVVPSSAAGVDVEEVRARLRQELPEHMVPSALVELEALPLTPTGKIDRRALPAPAETGGGYVEPRTPEEVRLAAIWGDVLKRDRVGAHDDFFALGGHSLLAMRVVSRIREGFGVEVPVRALFEAPTVAALVERVASAPPARPALDRPERQASEREIPRAPRDRPLPLSFAQQRLWFLDRMEPGSSAYNMPFPMRLRGELDPRALGRALSEIVRRHEVLRTVFEEAEGEAVQVIRPAAPVPLPLVDLRGLADGAREAEVQRLANLDSALPFDLRRGPVLRATLLRMAGAEWGLLLDVHHIAADGWSTGILVGEFSALYAAFRHGEPSPLPEPSVQYADFAAWQREWLSGPRLEEQLGYWRGALAGAAPMLDLPLDHPRPPVPSARGEVRHYLFSQEVSQGLRAVCRREAITPFMALLAAWQLLLARYSGQDDVSVGTAIAGRNRLELEGLIGFFVNTLVLRADLSGRPTVGQVLRGAREMTLGAFAHQDVPFEKLVEELAPERSLQHTPLFQVMFSMQNLEDGDLELGEVEMEPLGWAGEATKFDLSLTVREEADRFGGHVTYRTDLFEAETIHRMLEHFATLAGALAGDPSRPVATLPLMGEVERRRVLFVWNATAGEYPRHLPVHALFERQAERTPDAPALVWDGGELTYAELDARADALAGSLRARGVRPEVRVGVCLERGPALVAALLGVLKAGGVYVPLDPAHPAERLAYVLEDSGVAVLLTEERVRAKLPEFGGETVMVEEAPTPAGRGGEHEVTPEHLAYVIYTSGSTGRPKGVLTTHGGAVNYLAFLAEEYRTGPADTVLQLATASFDASIRDILGPLTTGAKLVLVRPEEVSDPRALLGRIREHGVTGIMAIVPSLLRPLLEAAEADGGADTLRLLLLSGEALPVADVRRAHAVFGAGVRVVNQWGATECTMSSTLHTVEDAEEAAIAPVGVPVRNTRVYVLDGEGEPTPVGVPGEAYIATPGVARGYGGRADLTAERFVPDPFSPERGARMYRVGDRVRWRRDGVLEFLGRMDAQVKVQGVRVEPGEVEAVLREHPGVRAAAVVAREGAPGEARLVGYVVGEEGSDVAPAGLRAWLADRLPSYLVPTAWVELEALPLLPNGKLDRRALPEPEAGAVEEAYVAPRTPTEEILAGIWSDVLGVERVGARDDFFALGGHSLLATRMTARVRQAFGVELPLRALFEAPTVGGTAERVEALLREGSGTDAPPLERVDRSGPLPLSFAQQRLWFIHQFAPGSAAYNMPHPLRLRGVLDVGALERALTEIVRRHESLRTVFAPGAEEASQVVLPAEPMALAVVDVSALPEGAREEEVRRRVAEESMRPFDLERGPLVRALLVRAGAEEHGLLFTLHHIIADGWSLGILVSEVTELYGAFSEGRAPSLPKLAVQYADYAAWQRAWLSGETLERHLAWWREQLAGAPPLLEVPTDRPRPPVMRDAADRVMLDVPGELAGALQALARREGGTLFMVLTSAFQALLGRWSGQEDVVVGTPIAGRSRLETEGLIGMFVNTLVLRTRLEGSFRETLARVRETTLGAYAHQEVPFEKLVEELKVERSLQYTPIFQAIFALQNLEEGELRLGGLELAPLAGGEESAKFDLRLTTMEAGDGLRSVLAFRRDLWDASTMARMMEHFRVLLEGVVADPDAPVSRLPLMAEAERSRVLEGWNGEAVRDYPAGGCVHDLFAAQAARTPAAPALAFRDTVLTYGELDAWSGRLASHLRSLGVGPEARVGVCLDRTPELVVALLAVLRAGGAYVPLDPAYPQERLGYMIEDAGARWVLTVTPLAGRLPESAAEAVRLDTLAEALESVPHAAPETGVEPENLSHVIFTSGSTGRPKGVMIRHASTVVLVHWLRENVSDEERSSVLFSTSINFDVSVAEIFGTLCWGGKLVMVENALELAKVEEPVVYASMVPTAAAELLRMGAIPASVRTLNLGGEPLPNDLAQALYELGTVEKVGNLYGPTEDTTYSTYSVVERGGAQVLVGRPVADTRALVLDRELEAVPVGVVGELYLAGAGLARGYAGRPELTAERFVPDPHGPAGSRMYRVLDRVRWRADGELEYFGRTDFQVKVRGFRIELGEIETVLRGVAGVREAVAIVREDEPGERRLVAYLTAAEGAEVPSFADLRAGLREHLPEYMVPSAFVVLERLPLTPNGKVDRRALPAPEQAEGAGEYVAPRGPAEELLAQIYAEVLKLERVGVHDDFFDLGGHSLLATRVVSRIREVFGVELPLRTLFEAPSVAELAPRIEALQPSADLPEWEVDEELARLADLSDEEVMRLLKDI